MSEPYWFGEGVQLWLGDCREVLPSLGLQADACVTDPPYGETASTWDQWPDGWVQAVSGALPESAALWCFGSARMFLDHHGDFDGWRYYQEALWIKRNGSGPGQKDRLIRIHEWAYQWYRGRWSDLHHEWERERTTANKGTVRKPSRSAEHQREGRATTWQDDGTRQPRSVTYLIEAPSVRYQKRHPDEKPMAAVEPLVRECTPPGGLVLDPFAGSGTTLLAAVQSGRRAIGVEGSEKYCEAIATRLSQLTFGETA